MAAASSNAEREVMGGPHWAAREVWAYHRPEQCEPA
jgi:hypothetical protein